MKYFIILIILPLLLVISGCSLSENGGLVVIRNSSGRNSTIRIGSVSLYTQKGGKYDYWFPDTFSTEVSSSSSTEVFTAMYYDEIKGYPEYTKNKSVTFKKNYRYEIDIYDMGFGVLGKTITNYQLIVVNEGYRSGGDVINDADFVHFPGE